LRKKEFDKIIEKLSVEVISIEEFEDYS